MSLKVRVTALERRLGGALRGMCRCPGLEPKIAVCYDDKPATPAECERCNRCGARREITIIRVEYVDPPPPLVRTPSP